MSLVTTFLGNSALWYNARYNLKPCKRMEKI